MLLLAPVDDILPADNIIEDIAEAKNAEEAKSTFMTFIKKRLDAAPELLFKIVLALIVFFIGIQIIKIIRKVVKRTLTRGNVATEIINFTDALLKVFCYLMLVAFILSSFGVAASSMAALLGTGGITIGLAMQGSLSNLAGSVLILLLKPFKVGDYICEDSNKCEGTVTDIGLFYTKLLTIEKESIVIPNGTLANTSLKNFSSESRRRIDLSIDIAYESNIQKAKETLYDIMLSDSRIDPETAEIEVFVKDLGDFSIILGCRAFVKAEDYWPVKRALYEEIVTVFNEKGIEIPYPKYDVYRH